MTKLTIDDHLIASLVDEIGPLVTTITGWDLRPGTLSCRIVPQEQGYEAILEGRLRALGLPINTERGFIDRILEYLVENNALAAYEPLTNELIIVRENVDDSNLDGLKVILGHELTHRGQHIHHPQLFDRVNRALQAAFEETNRDQPSLQKMMSYFEEVKPLMTLIESHGSYVQGVLCQQYFPQAQIEQHFTLPVLLFRVLGYGKTAQYTEGLPQVAAAMQRGNIDRLFRGLAST